MKKLLLLALLFSLPASATGLSAWIPNKAGGKIIITDQPCSKAKEMTNWRLAHKTTGIGRAWEGCWTVLEYNPDSATIIWYNEPKEIYSYPLDQFEDTEKVHGKDAM